MARIQFVIYLNPSSAEVFVNLKRKDGIYQRLAATVDTGAEISLLPQALLEDIDYRLVENGKISVEQSGIARQSFEAVEAFVTLFLEDQSGARTHEFEARVWFADTEVKLIGFDGILDRATLYIDMRQTRTGWLEIDP